MIWGLGFVLTRLALDEIAADADDDAAFRHRGGAVPVRAAGPNVSWPLLIAISATLFLGQFLAQTYGIAHGVPAGLASVIVQSQALFTVAFAALRSANCRRACRLSGSAIATAGLLMICGTVGYDFSVAAFAVLMISPVSFRDRQPAAAAGAGRADVRSVCMALSGRRSAAGDADTDRGRSAADLACAAQHVADRLSSACWRSARSRHQLAYWMWGRLLRDHTAAQVVPFALLVPFIGAAASSIVFGERFGPLRLAGMIIVVCGIAIMLLSKRPPPAR